MCVGNEGQGLRVDSIEKLKRYGSYCCIIGSFVSLSILFSVGEGGRRVDFYPLCGDEVVLYTFFSCSFFFLRQAVRLQARVAISCSPVNSMDHVDSSRISRVLSSTLLLRSTSGEMTINPVNNSTRDAKLTLP